MLPPCQGTAVRLPAGDYECWAASRDGLIWQRLHLEPGKRSELNFTGAAQRLQLADQAYIHPASLPSLSLQHFASEAFGGITHEILLRGAARTAPLISYLDGIATTARVVPGPPQRDAVPWPPITDRLQRSTSFRLAPDAPPTCMLLGLLRNDDRTFRIVAYASNQQGELLLPACPNGDSWLLLLANGHAALAQPWSTTKPGSTLSPPIGQPLRITARDHSGLPIADLAVSYTPDQQAAATIVAYTDAVGRAHFGQVTGPGQLLVNDPRYHNQTVELELLPREPLALAIADGETLTATVRFADDALGNNIVVTLRDPRANLRPAVRSLVATVAEPFQFAGLPSEPYLVLSASAQRDGKTWSTQRIVNALDTDIVLVLQNEDPVLHPAGR